MSRPRARGIAQSVQARLQAKADREARPYAELLQLYGIERFLYRLARSKHRDSLILKGAYLLKLWLGLDSRPTRDIDFLGPLGVDEEAVRMTRSCASSSMPCPCGSRSCVGSRSRSQSIQEVSLDDFLLPAGHGRRRQLTEFAPIVGSELAHVPETPLVGDV